MYLDNFENQGNKGRQYTMTIKEIAQMAGVSSAAVSRYLNGGYVSEQKKEQKSRKTGGKDWQPLWVHRLRPAACRAAALADAPDVCRRTLVEKGKRNGAKRVRERGVKSLGFK